MEKENLVPAEDQIQYCRSWRGTSPEIVEIGEGSQSMIISSCSREGVNKDVYVAVGKDDLYVVKWALEHAVSPGARVFLVHVFPPMTHISTPVVTVPRNQLSKEQVRFYVNEQNNKQKNLLQKYLGLCSDAKVTVETMLVESKATAKAILNLISVLNITQLVMGAKKPPASRRLIKGTGTGEFVKKNAPDFCEVAIVYERKLVDSQKVAPSPFASSHQTLDISHQPERNFFHRLCFSGQLSD